ncbi:MAG: bifunctional UDP-N-acetylglucosamine pyrophosphorylase / glucosamine-phosphate N-acetyltransferase [Blastocatellia bacterium]|jgi:bifunctional UDP-N-acetylglucosamine pyrophosphorylase/glucosamine-1-phosphate N-acetyltransferase|nr:bifunctional UDP-N-acetylglucosamine pyrophosphorylase / glucosamine-phosphate N-acetyltransferase [Blastocatellia bacterium]
MELETPGFGIMQNGKEVGGRQGAPLDILILAAGLGTRMRSNTAKVLHKLDGKALIQHVTLEALKLNPRNIYVVVGHQASDVEATLTAESALGSVKFVNQRSQRGTGDAVISAKDVLSRADSTLLILSGDVPLIQAETLEALVSRHTDDGKRTAACTMLSIELDDPTGYGRLIRNGAGDFDKIVEHKDATQEQRGIKEVNSGIYCFETSLLFPALEKVEPNNAQGEFYLTDVPGILRANNDEVRIFCHDDPVEVSGINTRVELAKFEAIVRDRTRRRLMLEAGVTFIDPEHTYVSSSAQIGPDCILYPGVTIEGESMIGSGCEIRSGSRITNSRIGDNVVIKDHSLIIDSTVGDGCSVGPFAHLRMNASIEAGAAVGNFVEIKKSKLGRGSKAMHLSYLGDATIGEKTNIGAGTITCNYDGKNKHETFIENGVKIGSDTMLVAPVRVGAGAVTAAGSVVTKDVPPGTLVAGVPAKVKKQLIPAQEPERR